MKAIERGLVKTSVGYMHYRASGSGTPLVMMHSSGSSSTSYLELMDALPDNIRGIAIDYPSCGQSDHTEQLMIPGYAQVIAEVLAGLGVTRASFVGAYGGAYVATELAISSPGLVDKIVMVNCPWYPDKATEVAHHQRVIATRSVDASGWPLPVALGTVNGPQELDPSGCPIKTTQAMVDRNNLCRAQAGRDGFQLVRAFEAYDLPTNLARIDNPVMNLMGEYYRYSKYMDDIARVPKHHTPALIKNACSDVLTEQPAEVSRVISEFLSR